VRALKYSTLTCGALVSAFFIRIRLLFAPAKSQGFVFPPGFRFSAGFRSLLIRPKAVGNIEPEGCRRAKLTPLRLCLPSAGVTSRRV
jgi:hypothetical protein